MTANGWVNTPLGDLLTQVSREELVRPTQEYRLLGARWYAKGLYVKDIKVGSSIRADRLYRVEQGDFVYNRLFAWKGSFAVASKDDDGCYVSNEFPCFKANESRLSGKFLWYYLSNETVWNEALERSSGGTPISRNRLKEDQFLSMQINLPNRREQDRIVAKLDTLAAKVEQAKTLHDDMKYEAKLLPVAMVHRTDLSPVEKRQRGWREVQLGDVISLVSDDVLVEVSKEYPNFGIYSFGRGLFAKPAISGLETSAIKLRRVRADQFIYSRLFAWEGASGIVPVEFDGWFVSNEYPTFDCDTSQILPEALFAYFQAEHVWAEVGAGSKGLGSRRQRVQPDKILEHRMMLPPMGVQQTVKNVMNRSVDMFTVSDEQTAELNAMLPSILDKAFKGEL